MSSALIGVISLGGFSIGANAQGDVNQDQLNKIQEIEEKYDVEIDLTPTSDFSLSSSTTDQFDEAIVEVEEGAALLHALVNSDDVGNETFSSEFRAANVVSDVLGTVSRPFDLRTFGGEWEDTDSDLRAINRNISFVYDYEEGDRDGVLPTFVNVSSVSTSTSGVEGLSWEEREATGSINSLGSLITLQAAGDWALTAEAAGFEYGLSMSDEWEFEFANSRVDD